MTARPPRPDQIRPPHLRPNKSNASPQSKPKTHPNPPSFVGYDKAQSPGWTNCGLVGPNEVTTNWRLPPKYSTANIGPKSPYFARYNSNTRSRRVSSNWRLETRSRNSCFNPDGNSRPTTQKPASKLEMTSPPSTKLHNDLAPLHSSATSPSVPQKRRQCDISKLLRQSHRAGGAQPSRQAGGANGSGCQRPTVEELP